jgi:hypothetical protein
MNACLLAPVSAALMLFAATTAMAAGKNADNRAPAPRAAATTSAKMSPFINVSKQVKADMKGSKNFKNCKTRACLHSHQH